MATEFVTLRDGSGSVDQLLPPGLNITVLDHNKVLGDSARDFLVETDAIVYPSMEEISSFRHDDVLAVPAYQEYIRMHKVLVGNRGAMQLENVYQGLKNERMPRYLIAAGSALAESALCRRALVEERLAMLDAAVATWRKAAVVQRYIEQIAPESQVEHDVSSRIALDIATAPLLAGMICGDVSGETCRQVFENCLNIAEKNIVQIDIALKEGQLHAASERTGFAYECNALLALNRSQSNRWFAIPAMARCDSGYYYKNQTHDLLVIRQKHGVIQNGTPVEIKGKPSRREKGRYDSLMVRGKMHLSVEGKFTPDHTLQAIAAAYRGDATAVERIIAQNATSMFTRMLQDYYAGEVLGHVAGTNTTTLFHDKTLVHKKYPGLVVGAA